MASQKLQPESDTIKGEPNQGAQKKYPAWILGLVGFGILTLVFIVILELLLLIIGVGYDTDYFVAFKKNGEKHFRENPKFFWKYMGEEKARTPLPVSFKAKKPDQVFRIIVFGESAGLGDPEPAFGFARYLEVLLEDLEMFKDVEVINTSTTAINSHVIHDIAKDATKIEADLWLGYIGNNEYMGPFGPGSVFGAQAKSPSEIKFGLWLRNFRTVQLMDSILVHSFSRNKPDKNGWGGMKMFKDSTIALDSPSRIQVQDSLMTNLKSIMSAARRAKMPLILAPAVSNLADCGPIASESVDGLSYHAELDIKMNLSEWDLLIELALEELSKNEKSAEMHYYLGRSHLNLGDIEKAKTHFDMACDLDVLPFRMPSKLRSEFLSLKAGDKSLVFDPQPSICEMADEKVPGNKLFFEHVHLKPFGNYALARTFADKILYQMNESKDEGSDSWMTFEQASERISLTPFDKLSMASGMLTRFQEFPLSTRPGNAIAIEDLVRWGQQVEPDYLQASLKIYESNESVQKNDWLNLQRFAVLLDELGDHAAALEKINRALTMVPHAPVLYYQKGIILNKLKRPGEAQVAFTLALKNRPSFAEALVQRAWIYWNAGKKKDAFQDFLKASQLDPTQESPQLALLVAEKEFKNYSSYWERLKAMAHQFPSSHELAKEMMAYYQNKERDPGHDLDKFLEDFLLIQESGTISFNPEIPGDSELFYILGRIYLAKDQSDIAAQIFFQSGLKNRNVNSAYEFGKIAIGQGDMVSALQAMNLVISMKPDFYTAYFNAGVAAAKLERYQQSLGYFSRIPSSDENYDQAQQYIIRLKALPELQGDKD